MELPSTAYAYFDNSMGTEFTFPRPINRLLLTVTSGTVNLSLDGGANFMNIVVGTYQFDVYKYKIIFSGGGVFSGFGVSL